MAWFGMIFFGIMVYYWYLYLTGQIIDDDEEANARMAKTDAELRKQEGRLP